MVRGARAARRLTSFRSPRAGQQTCMTEPTIGNDLSDQEGLPGELGTPEADAGPTELDPDTAADYGDGGGAAVAE